VDVGGGEGVIVDVAGDGVVFVRLIGQSLEEGGAARAGAPEDDCKNAKWLGGRIEVERKKNLRSISPGRTTPEKPSRILRNGG
jgi:hypothetical protein